MMYRHGYCDAIMGREANCPVKTWAASRSYMRGYMAGKKTGVRFNG